MKWRKWNNIIHRDLGYLCFGLSIIYAISGFMVNHTHNWNPNYKITQTRFQIQPPGINMEMTEGNIKGLLSKIGESEEYKDIFQPRPERLQVFREGVLYNFYLDSGNVLKEEIKERKVIRPMNLLHLNAPKQLWTYFADFYAISLGILAITGLFVLKGKKGLSGRGKWWTVAGVLIPIVFIVWYL